MKKIWTMLVLVFPFGILLFGIFGSSFKKAIWLGMRVKNLSKTKAAKMMIPNPSGKVIVTNIGNPAVISGVSAGDLIVGINGRSVHSVSDFLKAAQTSMAFRREDGRLPDVVLTLNRMGRPVVVTVLSEQVESSIRRGMNQGKGML